MSVELAWWGQDQDYRATLARQRARRDGVLDGSQDQVLALLEHRSVITTGRRAVDDLPDAAWLAANGIEVVRTERGGFATWHGPGQLTGYLIVDAAGRGLGARGTVCAVESGLIQWLQDQGVDAGRRDGHPGVWCALGKLAAIGLHFRKGVSMHGFALNLCTVDAPWAAFVPCGITDARPASLHELGIERTPAACWREVGQAVADALTTRQRVAT